jgi:FtsH-binding integral membrane protein
MRDYTKAHSQAGAEIDAGLRSYILNIYNYMFVALLITGAAAYSVFAFEPLTQLLYKIGPSGKIAGITGFGTLVMFAPLAFVLVLSLGINKLSLPAAQAVFWSYATIMGLSLSNIMFIYTGVSIARTFFVTACVFGAMSLYGYTTKKDLTSFGSFLIMGVFGIVLASIVNIFLASPMLEFMISILGVFIFTGLIAWDTQKLKHMYYSFAGNSSNEIVQKYSILGALSLYLDFINLFMFLLRFLGTKKD